VCNLRAGTGSNCCAREDEQGSFTVINGRIQGRRYDGCPAGINTSVGGIGSFSLNNNYMPYNLPVNAYSTGNTLTPGTSYNVSFSPPAGYTAQYSVCNNCIDHPASSWVAGNTVSVTTPSNPASGLLFSYVDLYWRCVETPSCTVSLTPPFANLTTGQDLNFTAYVSNIKGGTVSNVTFTSSNPTAVSLSVASDLTSPYQTLAASVSAGSSTITASCVMDGIARGSDTAAVTVVNAMPWWQVEGGAVVANGRVNSLIPETCSGTSCTPYLILDSIGLYPAVLFYKGQYDLGGVNTLAQPSSPSWNSNSIYPFNSYNFKFFDEKLSVVERNTINTNTFSATGFMSSGANEYKGYYVFYYDGSLGDLNLTGDVNVSNRKVILIVKNASLNIGGKINVDTGKGFFTAIIEKGINVNPTVGGTPSATRTPDLEGVYFTNGQFKTGFGDKQLYVRGSVVGLGYSGAVEGALDGVILERDLGSLNSTNPGELFEYGPDQVMKFATFLGERSITWVESNP